jgi:hypothetical protein
VQAVAPVIDKPKFLSAARRLFVSFTISKNATNTDFYVIEFSDYSVTLDNDQLSNLGYKLEKVSDCLVKVSGYDYSGFFMCAKQKEPPQTFGAQIAQTTDQVLPPAP